MTSTPPAPARTHQPPAHKNTYTLTAEGICLPVFYTKLQNRLLCPLLDADRPPANRDSPRAYNTRSSRRRVYEFAAQLGASGSRRKV
jgi:hypothetical protein